MAWDTPELLLLAMKDELNMYPCGSASYIYLLIMSWTALSASLLSRVLARSVKAITVQIPQLFWSCGRRLWIVKQHRPNATYRIAGELDKGDTPRSLATMDSDSLVRAFFGSRTHYCLGKDPRLSFIRPTWLLCLPTHHTDTPPISYTVVVESA